MIVINNNRSLKKVIEKISKNLKKNNLFREDIFDTEKSSAEVLSLIAAYYKNKGIEFPTTNDVILSLSYKNVNCSGFKEVSSMDFIQNGTSLSLENNYFIRHNNVSKLSKYLKETLNLIEFDKKTDLVAISNKRLSLIEPTEYEYNSMKNEVLKAHGNVLSLGFGIALFPYLSLLNESTESVTIVDNHIDKADFFNSFIFPNISRVEDIKLIYGKTSNYYTQEFIKNFDYVLVNDYCNEIEGLNIYCNLKSLNCNLRVDFWLEGLIVFEIKKIIFGFIECLYRESFETEEEMSLCITQYLNSIPSEFRYAGNIICNKISNINKKINTEKDLMNLLSDEYISNSLFK